MYLPQKKPPSRHEQAKTASGGSRLKDMKLPNKVVVLNPGHTLDHWRSFYTSQGPMSRRVKSELTGVKQKLAFRAPWCAAKVENHRSEAILALGQ